MKKANLRDEIARVAEISKRDARIILDVILDSMVKALQRGDRIELRRFGSFRTYTRPRRTTRNPQTGLQMEVPERRVPVFRSSRELIALVNELNERR